MSRKKKKTGHRRHGHHPHPANECGVCAHPKEDLVERKQNPPLDEDIPSLDDLPIVEDECSVVGHEVNCGCGKSE